MRIGGTSARTAWARLLALAICCLAVAGCSRQAILEKMSTPEDRALGEKLVRAIQSGDNAYVDQQLQPSLRPAIAGVLPAMRQELPSGPGAQVRLAGAQVTAMADTAHGSTRRATLDYEVDKGDRHDVVDIVIYRSAGRVEVAGLHVTRVAQPVDQVPPFELSGAPAWAYVFLALLVAAPLTCIWAFVAVLRTRGLKLKWLWAIGCLIGIPTFVLNWGTGVMGVQPFYFQLLGAGFSASSGGPWIFGVSLPLVAIIFLVRRAKRRERSPAEAF
jgi:hypothetical protein